MGRKKSLFSGGRHSVSSQIGKSGNHPDHSKTNNNKEVLVEREAARKVFPAVNLKGTAPTVEGGKHGTFSYDLTAAVERFPHHEPLIRQLLAGAFLVRRGTSRKSISTPCACIGDFVEFLNDSRNLSNTPVSVVSDITVTVCRAFSTYLISKFPRRPANAKRFASLRHIATGLQKEYLNDPSVGPILDWPLGPRTIVNAREGYTPESIGELVAACQRDIDETTRLHAIHRSAREGEVIRLDELNLPNLMFYLRGRLGKIQERTVADFIQRIVKYTPNAKNFISREGYTLEGIIALYETCGAELARAGRYPGEKEEDWTIENFMVWVGRRWEIRLKEYCSTSMSIKTLLPKAPSIKRFVEESGYSLSDVVSIYLEHVEELANMGRHPFGHSFNRRAVGEDAERQLRLIVATLAQEYPQYPFGMSLEAASKFLSNERYHQMTTDEKLSLEGRLLWAVQNARLDFCGSTIAGINLVRAAMHFLQETLYPFFLHVQINTGWNLESIVALTDDVDAHVTNDLLDPENYVVIQSVKTRGQQNGGKAVFHRCSRNRKFSTYNLLKYVESIVTQYKSCPEYHAGKLWQFAVRAHANMSRLIGCYSVNSTILFYSSKAFLQRHNFTYFNDSTVDHGRIRTSYETLREQQGLPLAVISHDMGHAEEETTSRHYAADSTSNAVKDVRIAEYQEQFVEELHHYQCRVEESLSLARLRDSIHQSKANAKRNKNLAEAAKMLGTDAKTVLHLISPEGQTYIAACRDSLQPTWRGHEEYLKPGQSCVFFNKCALCKQAVIFAEALPYIARRVHDLEQLRREINQFEWVSSYGEECDAWNEVLNDWNNREQVEAACQAAANGVVVLPIQMMGAK
jgi:hypothetical protein